MRILDTQLALETQLRKDIDNSAKNVNIFAGHLPLRYAEENGERKVFMDENWWGEFSTFTFLLGCKLLRYAKDSGKDGRIMIVVDDDDELLSHENGRDYLNDEKWHKRRRKSVRKKQNLPISYRKILDEYNLGLVDLVKQRFKKYNTILISERNLKKESEAMGFNAPNECSKAYKAILHNNDHIYLNPNNEYHICFIPDQCKTNLCEGIIETKDNVDASYIFFPHIEDMGGIVRMGVGHKKLTYRKPLQIKDYFDNGLVSYLKTTHNNVYNL